jgi:hypothetical protein
MAIVAAANTGSTTAVVFNSLGFASLFEVPAVLFGYAAFARFLAAIQRIVGR